MTSIGVHELHGRMHPNYGHVTNLFSDDPLSPSGYLIVTSTHIVAGNLPIKLWLPGNGKQTHVHTHTHTSPAGD